MGTEGAGHRWGELGLLLAVLLLPMAAYELLYQNARSERWLVQEVVVVGCDRLSEEVVLEAADLRRPRSLWTLRRRDIEAALATHPWIASAEVSVQWRGRVLIGVVEREARAVTLGESLWLLDEEGRTIIAKERLEERDAQLPWLVGVLTPEADAVDPLRWSEARMVMEAWARRADAPGWPRLTEVHTEGSGYVRVFGAEGLEVRLQTQGLDERLERLQRVLPSLEEDGKRATLVFLEGRDLQRVTVRFARDGAAELP